MAVEPHAVPVARARIAEEGRLSLVAGLLVEIRGRHDLAERLDNNGDGEWIAEGLPRLAGDAHRPNRRVRPLFLARELEEPDREPVDGIRNRRGLGERRAHRLDVADGLAGQGIAADLALRSVIEVEERPLDLRAERPERGE